MFHSILVPLDGSTFSEAALNYALGISRRTGADLHLATVHEPVPSFAYDEWEMAAREWSGEYLETVRDKVAARAGGKVDGWLGSGRVVDVLQKRADELDVDLVVMATHGRGALTRAWLGSVADGLVRHAHQPLLLVRPAEDGTATDDPGFDRMLVALDGSETSASILDLASRFANAFGAEIHLLRVVAFPVEIASPYLPHTVQMNQKIVDQARVSAEDYLAGIVDNLASTGVEATAHVVVDHQAGHTIAEQVDALAADLVVMATHGRGGLRRAILGSTTDKVIRSVHVPVLVQRPSQPE
jgi:nucleotide-binding universal stress UspA family protein